MGKTEASVLYKGMHKPVIKLICSFANTIYTTVRRSTSKRRESHLPVVHPRTDFEIELLLEVRLFEELFVDSRRPDVGDLFWTERVR